MFKLASLFVEITGQTGPLQKSLSLVHGSLMGLAGVAGGVGRGIGAALGGLLGAAGLGAGVAGLAGLGVALHKAVSGSMDLVESMSKVDGVFGDAKTTVIAGADEMARRFGVSKQTFLDAASSIGLIGKAAGQTQGDAAAMGTRFAKLAADVESFYNVPLDDALMAIRSGLVGEAEPMRRFGVLLDEEQVKLEAVRMGLAKRGAELTQQQKVMARAALITRGLHDATGDLEKTMNSPKNQARIAWGKLQNSLVEFGDAIAPVTSAVIAGFSTMAEAITEFIVSNKATIQGWSETIVHAFELVGFGWRNLGAFVQVGALKAEEAFVNIGELLGWLMGAAGQYLNWFGSNWPAVISDTLSAAWTFFSNFATNVKNLMSALWEFVSTGEFHFDFKPMLEGFKATAEKLPEIAGPALTSYADKISAVMDDVLGKEMKRALDKAAAAGGGGTKKQPLAVAAAAGKEVKLKIGGLEEFAKGLQEAAFGKEDAAKKTADGVGKLVGLQERANQLMQAAAKKPMPAVAVDPA